MEEKIIQEERSDLPRKAGVGRKEAVDIARCRKFRSQSVDQMKASE